METTKTSSLKDETTLLIDKPNTITIKIQTIFNEIQNYIKLILSEGRTKNFILFSISLFIIGIIQIIIFGTIYSHSLIIIFGGLHLIQISFSHLISGVQIFLTTSKSIKISFDTFSYGLERIEILFRFSNIIFLWFISFSMIVESFHHLLEPHSLNLNSLWLIPFLNITFIVFAFYFFKLKSNFDFNLLNNISKNVQNQKLFLDLFRDCLTQISILFSIILSSLFGDTIDNFITMLTSILLVILSINDLSAYSMILLQTSPRSIKAALSNCLREASSVEGVLECHKEHFWSIGKSLSQIVGTLKVRVTKNADEQLVLSQVHKIFSPLLSHLTIQMKIHSLKYLILKLMIQKLKMNKLQIII
eukprot:gene160-4406_t